MHAVPTRTNYYTCWDGVSVDNGASGRCDSGEQRRGWRVDAEGFFEDCVEEW